MYKVLTQIGIILTLSYILWYFHIFIVFRPLISFKANADIFQKNWCFFSEKKFIRISAEIFRKSCQPNFEWNPWSSSLVLVQFHFWRSMIAYTIGCLGFRLKFSWKSKTSTPIQKMLSRLKFKQNSVVLLAR